MAPVGVADDDIARRVKADMRGVYADVQDERKELHCLDVTAAARDKRNRI